MEEIQELINLKELSPLTQLTLERLVSGKVNDKSLFNRRAKAKKEGDVKDFFDIGLALYLYSEIGKIKSFK